MNLNVLPPLMSEDSTHLGSADTILSAKSGDIGLSSGVAMAKFNNLILSEFGNTVPAPTRSPLWMGIRAIAHTNSVPALSVPIERVVSIGSKKKVVGADTTGVVAVVENMYPRRDRPIVELPGNTVSPNLFPLIAVDVAIPMRVCGVNPEPTAISLPNSAPESLSKRPTSRESSSSVVVSPDKSLTRWSQLTTTTQAVVLEHRYKIPEWTVDVNATEYQVRVR